eukprot:8986739-Pyramimonas_sp.AAC.1
MSELGILPELGPQTIRTLFFVDEMVMSFLTYLELKISYRAVRHSNRKEIIWRASLQYLDA